MEDLSCKKVDDKENDFINIKKSLAKYVNKKDCTGNDYYYDTIQVMDPTQFKKFAEEKFTIWANDIQKFKLHIQIFKHLRHLYLSG